ncbi:type I secretion system permease/ATPase [Paenalcaligenes sp. Me131]|uniref:type I secretion system permease/ATPase n=1 Tax=Paenalcaligenes sp. Me131 TaxID=3392636 RepID=UPI003D2AA126
MSLHEAIPFSADSEFQNQERYKPWIEAVLSIAKHYRLDVSPQNLELTANWLKVKDIGYVLRRLAKEAGLYVKTVTLQESDLNIWRLPLLVQLRNGQVAVIEQINEGGLLGIRYSGDKGLLSEISVSELLKHVQAAFVLRPIHAVADARVDDYVKPFQKNWLKQIVFSDWRPYSHLFVASFLINVLGLSGILFTRQVYDRVIPAESYPTLFVLFSGVLVALAFVFVFRISRSHVINMLGKRADLRISDRVYGRVLRIRNSSRPQSTGSLIAQVREIDNIREMLTSATITALVDIPFFVLFCLVFWYLAGNLVWVPMIAVILMVSPSLIMQPRLRQYASQSAREASLRNAILVEAVQGYEDIKTTQSELRFQNQWNNFNAATADVSLKLRSLNSWLSSWTSVVQGSVFAVIVMFGAFKVIDGELSTGSVIAASILGTRMLAPMAKLTGVLSRWQQTKVAISAIDNLMSLPTDDDTAEEGRIHVASVRGNYIFKDCQISYRSENPIPALNIKHLQIRAGEKIGILGRNGAGKSTLLQTLSGLLIPTEGIATVEGVSLAHIDSADLRRDAGLLSQNASLFYGTIRENITLAAPLASDPEILKALQMTGAMEFIQRLPTGLDHVLTEGGKGLSGGQRQALLLCRFILGNPEVVLLDEPTSAMDDTSERHFIKHLHDWVADRTLVMATHKLRMLELVDRILVISNGKIVMDDKKQIVLEKLAQGSRNRKGPENEN